MKLSAISELSELAEGYLYAIIYSGSADRIRSYGSTVKDLLDKIVNSGPPKQGEETDEEYVVTLIRAGCFSRAMELMEKIGGKNG